MRWIEIILIFISLCQIALKSKKRNRIQEFSIREDADETDEAEEILHAVLGAKWPADDIGWPASNGNCTLILPPVVKGSIFSTAILRFAVRASMNLKEEQKKNRKFALGKAWKIHKF